MNNYSNVIPMLEIINESFKSSEFVNLVQFKYEEENEIFRSILYNRFYDLKEKQSNNNISCTICKKYKYKSVRERIKFFETNITNPCDKCISKMPPVKYIELENGSEMCLTVNIQLRSGIVDSLLRLLQKFSILN